MSDKTAIGRPAVRQQSARPPYSEPPSPPLLLQPLLLLVVVVRDDIVCSRSLVQFLARKLTTAFRRSAVSK